MENPRSGTAANVNGLEALTWRTPTSYRAQGCLERGTTLLCCPHRPPCRTQAPRTQFPAMTRPEAPGAQSRRQQPGCRQNHPGLSWVTPAGYLPVITQPADVRATG